MNINNLILNRYVPICRVGRHVDACLYLDTKTRNICVLDLYENIGISIDQVPDNMVLLKNNSNNIALRCKIDKIEYTTSFYFSLEDCNGFDCFDTDLSRELLVIKETEQLHINKDNALNIICTSAQYERLRPLVRATYFNLQLKPSLKAEDWTCKEVITKGNNTAILRNCMLNVLILPDCRRTYMYSDYGIIHKLDIRNEIMTIRGSKLVEIHKLCLPKKIRGIDITDVYVDDIEAEPYSYIDMLAVSSTIAELKPTRDIHLNADCVVFTISESVKLKEMGTLKVVIDVNHIQLRGYSKLKDNSGIVIKHNCIKCGYTLIQSTNDIEFI